MKLVALILLATGIAALPVFASPLATVTGIPVTEHAIPSAPLDPQPVLAQMKAEPVALSDFGLGALQRTQQSYVAGDSVTARRSLAEATDILNTLAGTLQAPGRGEVMMLVNDLRLIRFGDGGANPATLLKLTDAEARAIALAGRHPERSGPPAAARN